MNVDLSNPSHVKALAWFAGLVLIVRYASSNREA